jgi:chemotaxis protein MotA
MLVIIGSVVVLLCVFGAYAVHGDLAILWQPLEFVIILGAAAGAFITANTRANIKQTAKGLKRAFTGPTYRKSDYLELLSVLYQIFKVAKTKGMLALEQHVEKPDESPLFAAFPKFLRNHHAVEFLCDYLRMIPCTENPNEVETLWMRNWRRITTSFTALPTPSRPWQTACPRSESSPRSSASSPPWARSQSRPRCWAS